MKKGLVLGILCLAFLLLVVAFYLSFQNTQKSPGLVSSNANENPTPAAPQIAKVSFSVLDKGLMAPGAKNRKNYAIYDPTEFASFWKLAHSDSAAKLPSVDFSKEYVIAVFAGKKSSPGYGISVQAVKDVGEQRSVEVSLTEPEGKCSPPPNETSPYEFIAVPFGSEASIAHTDVTVKAPCP